MKAYVITLRNSNRLQNGKIAGYPKCLPEPEVVYGESREEHTEPIPFFSKKSDHPETWLCALGKIKVMQHHLETHPDEDLLLMEDDVRFSPIFDEVYDKFMSMVPDDWAMIFFGGYHYKTPKEVVPGVLRCCGVYGNECFLIRADRVKDVLAAFLDIPWSENGCDTEISTKMDKLPSYSPIGFFAGQDGGYSYICGRNVWRWGISTEFTYADKMGNIVSARPEDYLRYLRKPVSEYNVLVYLFGGIGNNLFIISFGRWLRSLGIRVQFVDKVVHGQPTRDFISSIGEEMIETEDFPSQHQIFTKSHGLCQALGAGYVNGWCFFKELRHFITEFKSVEIKDMIAVNFRRGDFLLPNIKNTGMWSQDLTETNYYEIVAKKVALINKPVRIVTDFYDDTIPQSIKDLFPNAEICEGNPLVNFYKLAECKYKFMSNSTFCSWAGYVGNEHTMTFYPKRAMAPDQSLPNWIGIDWEFKNATDQSNTGEKNEQRL